MSTLTDLLRNASVGEVIKALVEASVDRDGLAFDVAEALFERNISKEFPGQQPGDFYVGPDRGEVVLVAFVEPRREDAKRGFADVWGHTKSWSGPYVDSYLKSIEGGIPVSRPSAQQDAPQTREAAEAEAARWATYGVTAVVRGYEEAPKSHRRTLREHLCGGPTG